MIERTNLGLGLEKSKVLNENQESAIPFGEYLKKSIADVNSLQHEAEKLSQKLVSGEINDIHQVMIATEKASIALQFTMQIRNKLVEAYQEIMRMQM